MKGIRAFIHGWRKDPKTGLILPLPMVEAHSYVRQMIHGLMIQAQQAIVVTKDTGGADQNVATSATFFACNVAAGALTRGMVIGKSAQAVSISDNKLIDQVTASITHGSVSFAGPTIDGSTCYFDIIRTFTNNTGAILGIKEVGLYVYMGASFIVCADRTLYSLDVPIGEAVTLAYRISVTV